ncbi:MAG: hypothetical protein LBE74_07035 [Treponema sp.]|jgi:hypothetical protein|nr:hypothetical protein [Treponema sp.]
MMNSSLDAVDKTAYKGWRDEKYDEVFEQELRGLERRRANTGCTIEDIEGLLESLYRLDGDNWLGRGEVQDIATSATIAAHERFIAEWKTELRS